MSKKKGINGINITIKNFNNGKQESENSTNERKSEQKNHKSDSKKELQDESNKMIVTRAIIGKPVVTLLTIVVVAIVIIIAIKEGKPVKFSLSDGEKKIEASISSDSEKDKVSEENTNSKSNIKYRQQINKQESFLSDEEKRSIKEPPVNIGESSEDSNDNNQEKELEKASFQPKWNEEIELISTEDIQNLEFSKRVKQCNDKFDDLIMKRMDIVEIDAEMPETYQEYVIKANEIYGSYDDDAEYEEKIQIVTEAADKRKDAKKEYRQVSNEQIVGNYYAKCGLNAYQDGLIDAEYKYFQLAIDFYYDAYAVSCKNNIPRNSALEYIAICFYNISQIKDIDSVIKEQALLSAIAMFQKYGKSEEAPQLRTNLNIGRAYSHLCMLKSEANEKYFYFKEAVACFEKCYNDPNCQKKMTPIVYDELISIYQYCFDYISPEGYPEDITKDDIYKKHEEYVMLRNNY